MDVKLFAIYDRVAGTYGEPFCAVREELAVRRFIYVMDNAPMVADDCELYCVGNYNMDNGRISTFEKPCFCCRYQKQEIKHE